MPSATKNTEKSLISTGHSISPACTSEAQQARFLGHTPVESE